MKGVVWRCFQVTIFSILVILASLLMKKAEFAGIIFFTIVLLGLTYWGVDNLRKHRSERRTRGIGI